MDTGALFDTFVAANTFKGIQQSFLQLCTALGIDPSDGKNVYPSLLKINDWKATKLWKLLNKRVEQMEYKKQKAADRLNVLVVGAGPCGLRIAIECALLGSKVMVIEQREKFSRNNVLHLWEFVIHDLKALGAKIFYPKFCTGSIEHISIRQLQCILLKVALCFGVQVHEGVTFDEPIYPVEDVAGNVQGFRASLDPPNHILSGYEFDVLIGADGKRNTIKGFSREEMRGKLAIAITANFINNRTSAEERVPEISGVAYIFNQSFFKEMYAKTGVDLENIVYYKDDTHYFVMCAKKQSLLDMGVIRKDYDDVNCLLSEINVDREALCRYAQGTAEFATHGKLPTLDFAKNHHGLEDIAMFDFTSLYSSKHSVRVVERLGKRLLMGIVGDSLHEPFWPTGSGCARGFLGVFDTSWLIREYGLNQRGLLEIIAERESIYRLLAQVTKDNMHKVMAKYTIDPKTRYVSHDFSLRPEDIVSLFNSERQNAVRPGLVLPLNNSSPVHDLNTSFHKKYSLWRFCQQALFGTKLKMYNLDTCWNDGCALAALVGKFRPESLDVDKIVAIADTEQRITAVFDGISTVFGIEAPCNASEWQRLSSGSKLRYIYHVVSVIRQDDDLLRKSLVTPRAHSLKRKIPSTDTIRATRRMTQPIELLAQNLLGCSSFANKDNVQVDRSQSFRSPNKPQTSPEKRQTPPKIEGDTVTHRISRTELANMERKLLGSALTSQKKAENFSSREEKVVQINSADARKKVESGFDKSKELEKFKAVDDAIRRSDQALKMRDLVGIEQAILRNREGLQNQKQTACIQPMQQKRNSVPVMEPSDTLNVKRQNACKLCGQVVYLAERMQVESFYIHKSCFRCAYCGIPLRLGDYGKDKDLEHLYPNKFFCTAHLRITTREKIAKIQRNERQMIRQNSRESGTIPHLPADKYKELERKTPPSTSRDRRSTLSFFSPEALQTTPKRSLFSPVAETAVEDIPTPERAEFGSHIPRSITLEKHRIATRLSSSDSDEEENIPSTSNAVPEEQAKEEDESLSECEDLEEADLAVLESTVLEFADKHPDKSITKEQATDVLLRLNKRRSGLPQNTPEKRKEHNDDEQFYTPQVVFRKPKSDERDRSRSMTAIPDDFAEFQTPSMDDIRLRKTDELARLRSNSRARAQSKTDAELGLGDVGTPVASRSRAGTDSEKPRANSLLIGETSSLQEQLTVNTDTPRREKSPSTGMFSKILPTTLLGKKQSPSSILNADRVHCDSGKETSILRNFRKLRIKRGDTPTKDRERDILSPSPEPTQKISEPPMAAVAPSPRLAQEAVITSPIPVNERVVKQIQKKAEKIIRQHYEAVPRTAQEIERSIQEMEIRMEEVNRIGEEHEKKLTLDPTNRWELECWLALVREKEALTDAIAVAQGRLRKLQLHVRYRELTLQIKVGDETHMADPHVLTELLAVVTEKQKLDQGAAPAKIKRWNADTMLRKKGYDYRKFDPVFSESYS